MRARRKAAGRTIASIAVDAALSVPYIANLENGRGNPTVSALDRLASALGTRLEVTLVETGEKEVLPAAQPDAMPEALPAALADSERLRVVAERLAAAQGVDVRMVTLSHRTSSCPRRAHCSGIVRGELGPGTGASKRIADPRSHLGSAMHRTGGDPGAPSADGESGTAEGVRQ
jgi:transcriptional regulator with XRE-family HTH domain